MDLFKKFKKKSLEGVSAISRDELIEIMYDTQFEKEDHTVADAIYSSDRTRRIVIWKNDKGLFSYEFEALFVWDEGCEDWKYIFESDSIKLAMWQAFAFFGRVSLFKSTSDLMNEIRNLAEYKLYFE